MEAEQQTPSDSEGCSARQTGSRKRRTSVSADGDDLEQASQDMSPEEVRRLRRYAFHLTCSGLIGRRRSLGLLDDEPVGVQAMTGFLDCSFLPAVLDPMAT